MWSLQRQSQDAEELLDVRREYIAGHAHRERLKSARDAIPNASKLPIPDPEPSIPADDLGKFREARRRDYSLLLTKEELVGEHVSPEALYTVTEREIEAGRMTPDDDLRALAVAGKEALPSHAEMVGKEEGPLLRQRPRRALETGQQNSLGRGTWKATAR